MTFKEARRVMREDFKKDPDFRDGYVANVAMLLNDRYGIFDYEERNRAADEIIALVFGEKEVSEAA